MTHTLRVATLLLLAASPLFAQSGTPEYSVIELGGLPGDRFSHAAGINDAGQVVGFIFTGNNDDLAVLWDHGAPIVIGGLPAAGADSRATDINERGQVVGYGSGRGIALAFLWENGTKTPLARLGASSAAYAINDIGQIVGGSSVESGPSNRYMAVTWSGGVIINLGTSWSSATAINNRGQIIGSGEDGPFLWDNGVMSELAGLTSASDINDRGQILGLSDGRPVIWTYGTMTPLALPSGEWSVTVAAINDLGHAVGTVTSTAPGAVSMAVLWRNGEVITLPGLAANRPSVALDLNNRDEIVGWSQAESASGAPLGQRASLWKPQTPAIQDTTTSDTTPAYGTHTASSNVVPVGIAGAAQPVPIDLGTLGGTYSRPTGINDDGLIVGSSTTIAAEQHAFVWTPTTGMTDLGTLGDLAAPGVSLRTSLASAVSKSGQVVGASYAPYFLNTDGYRAFVWTPSAGMQNIGGSTGWHTSATAINDLGQVVGKSGGFPVFGEAGVLWTPTGEVEDLGTLGGWYVRPVAINNLGQVAGTSSLGIFPYPKHAFLWNAGGGMMDLGTLGGPSSSTTAANDRGHVVGWAQTAGASLDMNRRAFLWTATSGMTDLGSLGGKYSVARDLNEHGAVVGTSSLTPGDTAAHAFVWTSTTGMRDLGTSGGTHSEAYAVSETGQVVGRSLTPGDAAWQAFVWTANDGMVDLLPLEGYTDSSAYLVNNAGAVVGSSYDRASGRYRATMWVVPKDASQQLEDTIVLIASWQLRKLGTSLQDKLQSAIGLAAAVQFREACETLTGFLNQVRAQAGKALTVDQATELTMRAIRIRNVLGC